MAKDKQFLDSEEVYRIYRDNGLFIRRVIQFHLGNSPDSEDVFQSFFLRLLEKPIPKKEAINQRSYLYRMITNNIVDEVRRTRAYRNYVSRYSGIMLHNGHVYDPSEKIAQEDEINFIMHIIDNCLPAHIAVALRLRYQENHSSDQIAQKLSVKRKTVIKYLSEGLKKLREMLRKLGCDNFFWQTNPKALCGSPDLHFRAKIAALFVGCSSHYTYCQKIWSHPKAIDG